mgnify:CR=1 FL=1
MNIDYPNNQTPANLNKPNYSNQGVFNPALQKKDRGYYGNDNNANYYPNCNSGISVNNKQTRGDTYPNSNKSGRN